MSNQTLIIYDNKGNIFSSIHGDYLVPQGGIQFLEVVVPDGKQVSGVDVSTTPHQAILEDIPPSEIDKLRSDLDSAILELSMAIAMQGGGQ